jgi:hypothetical protein
MRWDGAGRFMLARLDKPLRPIGAVKTAEAANWGRTIVAIASGNEPFRSEPFRNDSFRDDS